MNSNVPVIITGTRRTTDSELDEILEFASEAGAVYVPRNNKSLDKLMNEHTVPRIIVWEPEGPVLYTNNQRFFYHPSMGKTRAAHLRKGKPDVMVEAMALEAGMSVLDCTMGLGADALVASYVVGPAGRVLAVESSRLIMAIVKCGIRKHTQGPIWLDEALRRIEIINAHHFSILKQQSDKSFDVVYFDPMFEKPVSSSAGISPMRSLANYDKLSIESWQEAKRVARHRVVVKERQDSMEFDRLNVDEIIGGKSSTIAYGVYRI
ncbi:MAG: class I SAM-dependent methyltransferase [Candidatus Saccharibacteria bacterium]